MSRPMLFESVTPPRNAGHDVVAWGLRVLVGVFSIAWLLAGVVVWFALMWLALAVALLRLPGAMLRRVPGRQP